MRAARWTAGAALVRTRGKGGRVYRPQVRTWLHDLQALNPQLGIHELLDVARLQLQAPAPPPPLDDASYDPGDPPHSA